MKNTLTPISVLLVTGFLAACGGGGSSSQDQQAAEQNQVVQASLRDCFTVTPGVQFTNSDGSKNVNVREQFEGQLHTGIRRIDAANTRAVTQYFALTDSHYQFVGDLIVETPGNTFKYTYSSDFRIPLNMATGTSVHITATETETDQSGTQTTSPFGVTYTFQGFENLSLAGQTLTNSCRFVEAWDGDTDKITFWFAKGYGIVKTETRGQNGILIQAESNQLASISVAP